MEPRCRLVLCSDQFLGRPAGKGPHHVGIGIQAYLLASLARRYFAMRRVLRSGRGRAQLRGCPERTGLCAQTLACQSRGHGRVVAGGRLIAGFVPFRPLLAARRRPVPGLPPFSRAVPWTAWTRCRADRSGLLAGLKGIKAIVVHWNGRT